MTPLDELPAETVYVILSYLPRHRDLATFCLISRYCYILAFTKLYSTLYIGLASQVEPVILRIATETDRRDAASIFLPISPHIRRLVFDDERYASNYDREQLICDDIVTRLAVNAVPYLTGLESIAWKSHWLPRNTKIFKSLRAHCPKLVSVELFNHHYTLYDEQSSYTSALYDFKKLKYLKITSENMLLGRRGVPPPIIQIIRQSPSLHTLELTMNGTGTWSPNKLLESVDLTFPNLRVLRLTGNLTTNWPILFTRPSPFLSFFETHHSLHTISLGWTPALDNNFTFEAEQMASLFPSLHHFEGPSFLCLAIVKSSLAPQLESLTVSDLPIVSSLIQDNNPSIQAVCDLAASAASLQRLSSLQFFVDSGTRTSRVIHELTRAAPELRELAINEISLQQLKISESLHAPRLRKLTIRAGIITPTRLRVLLEACPLLEEIRDTYQPRSTRIWRVNRRPDGSAELKVSPEYQAE